MHVRKGDTVIVVSGNDRGKVGVVREVHGAEGRVVVTGVNLRWRHRRPTHQQPKGERVQREQAIHASNVLLVDPQTGKGTRKRPAPEKK